VDRVADLDHRLSGARVAVIGAGWAGLAAAVTLVDRDVQPVVFEAARQPGGRARQVMLDGKALDNGQHILIGAYRDTLQMMRRVGADPAQLLLRLPLRLSMAEGFELRRAPLPAPLDTLYALLTAHGLTLAERLRATMFGVHLQRIGFRLDADQPLAQFLAAHGQYGLLRDALWGPLCVAALNTPVSEASAQVFLNVLRDTLDGGSDAADLLLPRATLGALFPDPAMRYLERQGGEIRLGQAVATLAPHTHSALVDGQAFDAVIVATAPQHAARLLPAECAATRSLIEALDYQPIYTCYLQYGRETRLRAPMIGFSSGPLQWAFDRGALDGHHGLIAAVISARGNHEAMTNEELAVGVSTALQPSLGHPGAPQWSRVIAEKRATFACRPNLSRPENATAADRIFLAGDYTQSGYPGTLETAIRSGMRAAVLAAQRLSPG
jgi:squalene-associated FAD-dependent desaturase